MFGRQRGGGLAVALLRGWPQQSAGAATMRRGGCGLSDCHCAQRAEASMTLEEWAPSGSASERAARARAALRTVGRVRRLVFCGDDATAGRILARTREEFERTRHIGDPTQADGAIRAALEAADFFRRHVVQAAPTVRGTLQVHMRPEVQPFYESSKTWAEAQRK